MLKTSVLITLLFLSCPLLAYDMKAVVAQLGTLGCNDLGTNKALNDWYLNVYRETTVGNPFADIFEEPLSLPHTDNDRQLTLFSLGRDNDETTDPQIAFVLAKLERLANAKKKIPDFKTAGIQQHFACYYKIKKVLGMKTSHITRFVFEEERLEAPLRDSVNSLNTLMYQINEVLRMYSVLEPMGVIFFDLTLDDFFTKKLTERMSKILIKNSNLGMYSKANILGEAREHMMRMTPEDMYEFPGYLIYDFMFKGKLEEWHFGPFFNRWRMALIFLNLIGIDVRKFFNSYRCESVYMDGSCVYRISRQIADTLTERFNLGDDLWPKLSALGDLIQDLMENSNPKQLKDIIAEYQKAM